MENAPFPQNSSNQTFAFYARWFGRLFWLSLLESFISILWDVRLLGRFSSLFWPGRIVIFCITIGYCVILLLLSRQYSRYRAAAVCLLVSAVLNIVSYATWSAIFAVPAAILSFTGEYLEFYSHAAILSPIDAVLPSKWKHLFKWELAAFCVSWASSFVLSLSMALGNVLLYSSLLLQSFLGIVEIFFLYRTARTFREARF